MIYAFFKKTLPCFLWLLLYFFIRNYTWVFKKEQEMLCVVAIAMICSILASLWKFHYFWKPMYDPVEHLSWSFYSKNSNLIKHLIIKPFDLLNIIIFTKTKTLVNNLLMNKLTANPAKSCVRKTLRTRKNLTYTKLPP